MSRQKKRTVLEQFRIEDFASEGKSLGRWDGKVVFVERTVPGDLVDVFLYKNKKDWAEGYPLRFHEYSSLRTEPFCSHFGDCGGCQWQMIPYPAQLVFKEKQIQDALQRIGKQPLPEFFPIMGGQTDRYYRNKLEYTFGCHRYIPESEFVRETGDRPLKKGNRELAPVAGFHAKGLWDKIVHIDRCHLQAEPSNEIRNAVFDFAIKKGYTFYDVRLHNGFLRNLQLRICVTGEIMANVIVGEDNPEWIKDLMEHLLHQVPSITTLLYTVNTKKNDSLHGLEPVVYSGRGFVIEQLEDFRFKIGPKSFFQTNTLQAERLYRVVRDFAECTGKETVYDLYCGTGSIGIFVSREAKRIIGVDMIDEAILDARENAALNTISESFFYTGDVTDICNEEFFSAHGTPDVIITDPPRAGMHEKLVRKILDLEAPVVVYVSCNPATQGRDLNQLGEKYKVTKVQPVDMFPHTSHMENVLQLKLNV